MQFSLNKNLNYYIAFVTTLIVGLLAHIYAMVNPIFNDDAMKVRNIGMFSGGPSLGRWFAEIINTATIKMGYIITVPLFAYFLCLILISICSVLFIKTFEIKNQIICVYISALFITSTSIVQLWSYDYTAINSMLAILTAFLSSYFVQKVDIENKKSFNSMIIGTIIFALSIGIYQISIPIYLSILTLKLVKILLIDKKEVEYTILNGILYLLTAIIGVFLYIVLNRLVSYYLFHMDFVGGYYGMSSNVIANYNFDIIFNLLVRCIVTPLILPFINYAGISTTLFSKIIILLIYLSTIVLLFDFTKIMEFKNKILLFFLLLFFLISVNFQRIMVTKTIQTRMTFSIVFIFVFPLVLVDNIKIDKLVKIKRILSYLIILLILHLTFVANANYYTAHIKNIELHNLTNQIVSKIINVDGYRQDLPLVFIGNDINNQNFIRYDYNENNLTDQYILNPNYLFEAEERDSAFKVFANFKYELPEILTINDASEIPKDKNVFYKIGTYGIIYSNNNEIINMPCYPDDGCVRIINGVVVVKISN